MTVLNNKHCLADMFGCGPGLQLRAKEVEEHEEQLESWKTKFKAEAVRQITERERTLTEWQTKLEARKAELETLQKSMEVNFNLIKQQLC